MEQLNIRLLGIYNPQNKSEVYEELAQVFIDKIYVPTLREHLEDIPILTDYKISILQEDLKGKATQSFSSFLHQNLWPGNVRELFNTIAYYYLNQVKYKDFLSKWKGEEL